MLLNLIQSKLNVWKYVLTSLHFINKCGSAYRGENYKENNLKGKQFHFELAGC